MNTITIIGLGAADINQLPLGVYRTLKYTEQPIYLRTKEHPVVTALESEGMQFYNFDDYYKQENQFADVYDHIVTTLLEQAKQAPIIYAVPGHPMLAEQTVQLLLEQTEVEVNVVGGQSYLDSLFTSLNIDPIEGFQFLDGTDFRRCDIQYRQHIVFCQVYDRFIASEVKLALLEDLPADYEITLIEAAGSNAEKIVRLPLNELDHAIEVSNLTSIYVPPVPDNYLHHQFNQLRETIAALRGPGGCPWDQKQTHETLRPYLIEETYELIDAINEQDDDGMIEELGDVLLQVLLHSQIGEDDGYFTIEDVISHITAKMIHRHPHVFKPESADAEKSWDTLKYEETGHRPLSVLEGISHSLPALSQSYDIQKRATKVGFQWDDVEGVWDKVREELQEVKEAIKENNQINIEKELGDVLFSIVNLTLFYDVNPEIALNRTNRKFTSRFQYIEKKLSQQGVDIGEATLKDMNKYWDEAKGREY